MAFLRRPPASRRDLLAAQRRVRRASGSHQGIARVSPTTRGTMRGQTLRKNALEDLMKKTFFSSLVAVVFLCTSLVSYAEPHQVAQGTRVRLRLVTDISSSSSRDGDPFVVIVSEPVFIGNRLLIPMGTRINGTIGTVEHARHFSLFRGQAYMNLTFRSMEIDSRVIPIQMSILAIEDRRRNGDTKNRKDIRIDEGQVLQEKHDYKGDVIGGTIGTGGGALVGAIFSNVARGFGFGIAGSAIYIAVRKGKEVELPAETGMLARLDSTVTVPTLSGGNLDSQSLTGVVNDSGN
jgi:hypothetical protein